MGKIKKHETIENSSFGDRIEITIKNPYQLSIRWEKHIAMVLGLSRSQVKSLLEKGEIDISGAQGFETEGFSSDLFFAILTL